MGIEALDIQGITELMRDMKMPAFRSKQLVQWLYHHQVTSYDQMTNLPLSLRETLEETYPINAPVVEEIQISKDGSRKYLLKYVDGSCVETVGIPSFEKNAQGKPKRLTVCFSTQVGCSMQCAFCATGHEGFTRNLLPGEIVQQVLCVQRDYDMRATNVVAMGQGEPFLNYDNVLAALHIINHPDALNIGARHITVSTCGVLNGIKRFGGEPEQFTLAVSLHAARQTTRDVLMPRCKNMTLDALKIALQQYYESAKRRITFEYLMIHDINDTDEDLRALVEYCKGLSVHVNIIPLNSVDNSPWKASDTARIRTWLESLEDNGIGATLRNSRGSDIDGACGQLKNSRQ